MRKQIIRVSPLQTAKVMAVLYFVMSLPFGLMMLAMPMPEGAGFPWWMLILMPLAYMFFGFLFSLIGAWVYNLVAARVGGFEYTTVDVKGADQGA
jgi:hypothetical protein